MSANQLSNRPLLISVAQYEDELKSDECTVFDVIETAHRLGADGVELRRETWINWQGELEKARARGQELGLLVTYATHVTLFSEDEAGQEVLRGDIDAASTLGSPILRVFQGPAPASDDAPQWDAARKVISYAATKDVIVALENYVGMPGGTLAEITRVLRLIDAPALGTNIDIGNYHARNEDIVNAIRTVGSRAVSAHIKDKAADPNEPPTYLGAGVLPLAAILAELDKLPQPIICCFEFRGGGDPEGRIQKSLAFLRNR
ncbi:MAG: sugar phosphate isomerase/epimerase family protein [Chloroflexota bacterium]